MTNVRVKQINLRGAGGNLEGTVYVYVMSKNGQPRTNFVHKTGTDLKENLFNIKKKQTLGTIGCEGGNV